MSSWGIWAKRTLVLLEWLILGVVLYKWHMPSQSQMLLKFQSYLVEKSHVQQSYLHYGLLAARAEILKVDEESGNPCILAGYNGSYKYGQAVYKKLWLNHLVKVFESGLLIFKKFSNLIKPPDHRMPVRVEETCSPSQALVHQ